MFNFICTYLELGQQSEQDKEQSNSQGDDDSIHCLSLEESMEATAEDQENLADLEKRIVTTYCSQTSDTITITLSLVSKTTCTNSQDLNKASTERTECQTMDGIFLSVNEYATLLEKASFPSNFRDNLAKI